MGVPDLFIVGATKCATSSIHYQLGQSRYISASRPKEPRFLEDGLSLDTARREYRMCFGDEGFRVEANPNHFVIGYAPHKIKLINPDAKILIMIREPVARYWSHVRYFLGMRPGRENPHFGEYDFDLDKFTWEKDYVPYVCPEWGNYRPMYLETGCYSYYIPKFASRFDTKIIVFEEYIENPQNEIDQIMDWIGLPRFVIKDLRIRNENIDKSEIDPKLEKELFGFYESYNDQLFEKLGRELWKS